MATRTSKSKAEINATLLKSLLKLPGNKFCCDCKVADHPRWASWNLGIFLCIRCSGIHRSMGTHISRVKSVDLDAWTDEQTQSMVKWGNQKANKYWESKLEQSHVPSEGKIDNFVKTKYVSRRWVAAAERPDPDEISDEEGPTVEAVTKSTTQPARPQVNKSSAERAQNPRTRDAASAKEAPNQQIDSLLGMDFINAPQAGPAATAPTAHINPIGRATNVQAAQSNLSLLSSASLPDVERHPTQPSVKPRNDLKTSIMSLYASAPKPQHCPQIQQYPQSRQVPNSFNSTKPALPKPASAFDDLNGLFGGMNVQAASSSQRVQSGPPLQTASPTYNGLRAGSQAASRPVQTTHSIPAAADPWGNDDGDEWTSFQNQTSTPAAPKQSSAFDDLYSTSDVWK